MSVQVRAILAMMASFQSEYKHSILTVNREYLIITLCSIRQEQTAKKSLLHPLRPDFSIENSLFFRTSKLSPTDPADIPTI